MNLNRHTHTRALTFTYSHSQYSLVFTATHEVPVVNAINIIMNYSPHPTPSLSPHTTLQLPCTLISVGAYSFYS